MNKDRRCSSCRKIKSIDEFHKNDYRCKKCNVIHQRDMNRRKYGITNEEYDIFYKYQRGCCAICGKERDVLCVDHDHRTGKIRGLLCRTCNYFLGVIHDDPKKLAEYLNRS